MKSKRIILIRHGESTANKNRILTGRSDPDLTRNGYRQAKKASQFIKNRYMPVDILYTSPLKRAFQTADIIAGHVKTPLKKTELLTETDFGNWEGMNKNDLSLESGWDRYIKDPFHFQFPGGESPQDVKNRVMAFKEKIHLDTGWNNAVIVSHYTPIAFFILSILGNGSDTAARFKIDNAALSVIEKINDFEYIGMLNYVP